MCGICGVYSTNFSTPEREIFQGLLLLNVWRGKDSTGVVRVNDPKDTTIPLVTSRRSIMASPGFISTKSGHELLFDPEKKNKAPYALIGHTRAATKGEVKLSNAHPFTFDNVCGVHNGTIKWMFDKSKDFDTDSEALYANINEHGIEKALNVVANSDPAYALVYVDRRDGTLNFVKNNDRPLYFTYLYNRTTLIWSSQREMIEFVLARRGTALNNSGWDPKKTGDQGYFSLNENHLMSIKIGESLASPSMVKLDVKKPHKHTYTVGAGQHWGDYSGDYQDYVQGVAKAKKGAHNGGSANGTFRETYTAEELSGLDWLLKPDGTDDQSKGPAQEGKAGTKQAAQTKAALADAQITHTPRGEPVSQSERNFRFSQGCFCCGTVIRPNDHAAIATIQWWNREHFACGDCYTNTSGETDWVRSAIDDDWPTQEMLQIANLN